MAEKKSEMSLDEVLSSIKQMVVDAEPPVLDLTDMVTADGTVVKVGENESEESMGAFLKLAQDSADEDKQGNTSPVKTIVERSSPTTISKTSKDDVMTEIFKDIAAPEVKKWLDTNLSQVVSNAVRPAIHEWLDENIHSWLDENLPQICGKIAEREILNLLNKSRN